MRRVPGDVQSIADAEGGREAGVETGAAGPTFAPVELGMLWPPFRWTSRAF